jgi:hypothetical protein
MQVVLLFRRSNRFPPIPNCRLHNISHHVIMNVIINLTLNSEIMLRQPSRITFFYQSLTTDSR